MVGYPVMMRYAGDCEVAAIATAAGVTWEEARAALDWKKVPGGFGDPVFGNPVNLYRALLALGRGWRNITLTDLLEGRAAPGKTVVLVHFPSSPLFAQHWIVYKGTRPEGLAFDWGDGVKVMDAGKVRTYFLGGWPNCAFEVTPWRTWGNRAWAAWQKIRGWWK